MDTILLALIAGILFVSTSVLVAEKADLDISVTYLMQGIFGLIAAAVIFGIAYGFHLFLPLG